MAMHTVDESFDRSLLARSSCAIGVFDGLHAGHRFLIRQAARTRPETGRTVVITFDPDPDELFHSDRLKKLMRNDDRLAALQETEADDVVVVPFTEDLCARSPDDFLAFLFGNCVPAHVHVGEDFRFGSRASGDLSALTAWGDAVGCAVHGHRLVSADGKPITATRIRNLLESCDVKGAARLLGRPYRLHGTVCTGRGEGTAFGFATANLEVGPQDRVLGDGVYAAYAHIGDMRHLAAVSVGVSPTFQSASTANVEAHILDFEGDLVGREIALDFVEHLRPMMRFESTDELVAAVTDNIRWIRENLPSD